MKKEKKVVKLAKAIKRYSHLISKAEAYAIAVDILIGVNKVSKGLKTEAEVLNAIKGSAKLTLILEGVSISSSILLAIIDPSEEKLQKRAERKARREERKAAKEAKNAEEDQDEYDYDDDGDDDCFEDLDATIREEEAREAIDKELERQDEEVTPEPAPAT